MGGSADRYWLVREATLRALAAVYAIAFLVLWHQGPALLGPGGLLPIGTWLQEVDRALPADAVRAFEVPTLFWLGSTDGAIRGLAATGLGLSLAALAGLLHGSVFLALWVLYQSVVQAGQLFYGYGWETMLLEAGFLAVFLAPWRAASGLGRRSPPPFALLVLQRWLICRVMLGAGLIKLRGDPCWRDLTCLVYHYETQPVPNPLSWYLHAMPAWFHQLGVAFNHLVELIAPCLVFGPRRARLAAGIALVAFQAILIVSGNLSFLNWLTLALCLPCFDDAALAPFVPRSWRAAAEAAGEGDPPGRARGAVLGALCLGVAWLSLGPVINMLSPAQRMNSSFDRLHLVNTYGAFGSIGRAREEVVIQGSDDGRTWRDYELPCKPGDPARRPCWLSPYHYRLDWQLWFAPFADARANPWLVHLVFKLLQGAPAQLALFETNPFPARPPRFIRVERYRYAFAPAGPAWWTRQRVGPYLPPLTADDPRLVAFARAYAPRATIPP